MPCERWRGTERSRHGPFAPRAGRRCRQADEGLISTATLQVKGGLTTSPEWHFLREKQGTPQCASSFSSPCLP
ncbi:hypothetical protein EFR84_11075 [Rhizobium chutanense]|uniref:Uncharacterized protein n=1 Tax=Rhizobium chutanense TaxID=2035448 RepID=A0A3S0SXR3_9HYPH|nr:hypothetical protein EFR84_11075 [Rhizobium chutanense]